MCIASGARTSNNRQCEKQNHNNRRMKEYDMNTHITFFYLFFFLFPFFLSSSLSYSSNCAIPIILRMENTVSTGRSFNQYVCFLILSFLKLLFFCCAVSLLLWVNACVCVREHASHIVLPNLNSQRLSLAGSSSNRVSTFQIETICS